MSLEAKIIKPKLGLLKLSRQLGLDFYLCMRPASSMVMVDRGEIFSKGTMATK